MGPEHLHPLCGIAEIAKGLFDGAELSARATALA
jgi:hypothetical protein